MPPIGLLICIISASVVLNMAPFTIICVIVPTGCTYPADYVLLQNLNNILFEKINIKKIFGKSHANQQFCEATDNLGVRKY